VHGGNGRSVHGSLDARLGDVHGELRHPDHRRRARWRVDRGDHGHSSRRDGDQQGEVPRAADRLELLANERPCRHVGRDRGTAVTFNKVPATSFSVDSYSQITATVPCCGASGRIKVTTPGGSGSSRTSFKVPPSITSFSPSSGPVGTTVVIVGVAFTGTKSVTFNGVAATRF